MPAARTRSARALALSLACLALLACGADGAANANADAGLDAGDATANGDANDDSGTADTASDRACPGFEPWPEGRHPGPCVIEGENTHVFEDVYTWSDDGRIIRVERYINFGRSPARLDEYSYSDDGRTQTVTRYFYGDLSSTRTTVTGSHGVESDRLEFPDGSWAAWTHEYDDDGCLSVRSVTNSANVTVRYGIEYHLADGMWTRTDRALGRSDLVNVTTLTPWGDALDYTEYVSDAVFREEINTFDAVGNQLTADVMSEEGTETSTYDYSCW